MRIRAFRNIVIAFPLVVAIILAMIAALPGLRGAKTEALGIAVAERKLMGLQVGGKVSSVVPVGDRGWIRNHRVEARWADIESSRGIYNWSALDALVGDILAMGSESILLLIGGPTPAWAQDPQYGSFANAAPPRDLNDWYLFCAEIAENYGSVVDFYEIWNEPGWDRDSQAFQIFGTYHFGGQVETDYLPLLQLAYTGIKEKDSTGIVVCGALMYSLTDDPNIGAENYALLFDDLNRPGQDVSIKVTSPQPIVAERPMYFNYNGTWAGGHDAMGATAAQTEWLFAEGCTRPGFNTWLCLQNPGATAAAVSINYYCGDGYNATKTLTVPAHSRFTVPVHDAALGIGVFDNARGDVSIKVTSPQPIVAERPMYFNYNGTWAGGHDAMGATAAQTEWLFAEGCTGYSIQEYLCLQNPNATAVEVELTFMMSKGESLTRKAVLAPLSRTTLDMNRLIGFNGSCDMIAVHPYKSPSNWGSFYANVVNTLRSRGAWHEAVATEIGWPHYSDRQPGEFSEAGQAAALGDQGVRGLFDNGCKKIWVYRDVDEDPGTSWDGIYYGLFKYTGSPHPAWYTYVQWQQQIPDYPLLPTTLP